MRVATARLASRGRQHSILCRPVQLLYPLEICFKSAVNNPVELTHDPQTPETHTRKSSPSLETMESTLKQDTPEEQSLSRRAAARWSDDIRREWIAELNFTD